MSHDDDAHEYPISDEQRRRFLQAIGVAGLAGVAGCLGDDDDDPSDDPADDTDATDDADDTDADDTAPVGDPHFDVSGLTVSPDSVQIGESVQVSADITNTGDAAGAQEVEVIVDGESVDSVTLELGEFETDEVSFDVELGEEGDIEVGIRTEDDEATTTVTVDPLPTLDDALLSFDTDTLLGGVNVLQAEFSSSYNFSIYDGEAELSLPGGWDVLDASGTTFDEIDAFGDQSVEWEIEVPGDADGTYDIEATVTYDDGIQDPAEHTVSHTVEVVEPLQTPYGVNAGGFYDPDEGEAIIDTRTVGGVEFESYNDEDHDLDAAVTLLDEHNSSGNNDLGQEIADGPDEIYNTMMWSPDQFGYEFLLPAGEYEVIFHVAEIFFTDGPDETDEGSQRTFSAWVDGDLAFEDLQPWQEPLTAMPQSTTVNFAGGALEVWLEASVENPMINAIEIRHVDDYVADNAVDTPYGANAGGVSLSHPNLSTDDAVRYNGLYFEPYTEQDDLPEGVTLLNAHNTSGSNDNEFEIEGTDGDAVYQTMMWGSDEFGYEIEVEPGTYDVTFHIAEIHWGEEAGSGDEPDEGQQRTYSGWVNDEIVFEDLEPWQEPLTAMPQSTQVEVEDEPLHIWMESSVENPMINGISIVDPDDPVAPLQAPYGMNVGAVAEDNEDYNVGDTVWIDGIPFEPYNEDIAPDPAVTLTGDHNSSGANASAEEIDGTDNDVLYQTLMFGGDIGFDIDLAAGEYDITFHFNELFSDEEGDRVFSVDVGGDRVIEELDIYAEAGQQTAHDVTVTVDHDGGELEITTETHADNAMFNAISIVEHDPLPTQFLWEASDYDDGETPDDSWEEGYAVDTWEIASDDDGQHLQFGGGDGDRTFLRFHEAGESTDTEVWARIKSDDSEDGDYYNYLRGMVDDDHPSARALRYADHSVSNQFRLGAYHDGYDPMADTDGDRLGIDFGDVYDVRVRVEGDDYMGKWWPAHQDEPEEWTLEVDLSEEAPDVPGPGYTGLGHWTGANFNVYAYGVGTEGDEAPSVEFEDTTQFYWSAEDYDEGDTPDDAWEPADDDIVESFAIGSDDDGNYLAFDGEDSTRAFLRFLPAGSDASDVQIWARAKSELDDEDGGGDYGYYFRGENDLDDGDTHTLRFDDHAVSDQFRLSAFVDNSFNGIDDTGGDRHGIGHGEAYETYGLVDGDTYAASFWPAGEGQPTEWTMEVDLDDEGVGIDGPGHLGLMYHAGEPLKIYEFGVGIDGDAAPQADPADQFTWTAADYEGGDFPDDAWEPMANVDTYEISSDGSGQYMTVDGPDDERTFLRFVEPGEAEDVEVWAQIRTDDDGGDYYSYLRGVNDSDNVGDDAHAARFDDNPNGDNFRLSRYDDGGWDAVAESGDRLGIAYGEPYQVRARIEGDDYMAKWWPASADEPDEWDLEADAPIDGAGFLGLGHWNGDAYGCYAWSVGVDGAPAPTVEMPAPETPAYITEKGFAWWQFDEGDGDEVVDSIGDGDHDGTMADSDSFEWVEGDWAGGYAIQSDGDSWIETSTMGDWGQDLASDFAIAYTIDSDDDSGEGAVVGTRDSGGGNGLVVMFNNSFFGVEQSTALTLNWDGDDDVAAADDGVAAADPPHRIVVNKVTTDPENWQFWVDGVQVSSEANLNDTGDEDASDVVIEEPLQLFGYGFDDRMLAGTLDDILLLNDSLNEDEIQEDFDRQPWT